MAMAHARTTRARDIDIHRRLLLLRLSDTTSPLACFRDAHMADNEFKLVWTVGKLLYALAFTLQEEGVLKPDDDFE